MFYLLLQIIKNQKVMWHYVRFYLKEPNSYVTLVQVLFAMLQKVLSAVANRNYQEPKSYVTLAQVLSALLQIEIK